MVAGMDMMVVMLRHRWRVILLLISGLWKFQRAESAARRRIVLC